MQEVKIIVTGRDAGNQVDNPNRGQGAHIQSLLRCGFDTIDFAALYRPEQSPNGRYHRPPIPTRPLADPKQTTCDRGKYPWRGRCRQHGPIIVGYPFSISENFQMRNTHKTIAQSIETLKEILDTAFAKAKKVVAYLSMGFGNPYGDPWNVDIVAEWTERLSQMGVRIISLSDTIGSSDPKTINYLFSNLIPQYPDIEFGAHLHTTPSSWHEKVDAAYKAGCRRFDGAAGLRRLPNGKRRIDRKYAHRKTLELFYTGAGYGYKTRQFESSYNEANKIFQNAIEPVSQKSETDL